MNSEIQTDVALILVLMAVAFFVTRWVRAR